MTADNFNVLAAHSMLMQARQHLDAGNLGAALIELRATARALIAEQLRTKAAGFPNTAGDAWLPAWWPLKLEHRSAVAEILKLYHSNDATTPTIETIDRAVQAWLLIGVQIGRAHV